MAFFLRKLVGLVLSPSVFLAGTLVLGALLYFSKRGRAMGRRLLFAGAAAIVVVACGIPFQPIGRGLEARYPAILSTEGFADSTGVTWIAVLGSGLRSGEHLPPSSIPVSSGLYRIAEGVRPYHRIPGSRLILSGYAYDRARSYAEISTQLAVQLGVAPSRIDVEPGPRTTSEEAARARALVGDDPILLVTSALHMPRAVLLFEAEGVNVTPAPTDHRTFVERGSLTEWLGGFPERVTYADDVMHELLGLLAIRLGRG